MGWNAYVAGHNGSLQWHELLLECWLALIGGVSLNHKSG